MMSRGFFSATVILALLCAAGTASASTQLRVAHLSPDAPPVDIWVNGSVALSAVPFGVASDYLDVDPGEYQVQVTPTGETEPVVIDATLTLEPATAYTVAATGLLGEDDLLPIVRVDDRDAASGDVKVRFTHTSPDAPPVDLAVTGGGVLFPNVAFRAETDYLTVAPGTYDLEVRLAGTTEVVLPLPGVELAEETNYDFFAIGLAGDMSLSALPLVTAEPVNFPSLVRVAHLSPDAPPVDIRVDGDVVLQNVPFSTVSEYLELSPGDHRVQVSPFGQEEPVVIDATLTLEEGVSYTVAATGLLGAEDLQPAVYVDDRAPDADKAKVTFVHTSPDAPPVDIAVAGGPVLVSALAFRDPSQTVAVDAGTYDLEVRLAGTDSVALSVPGVAVAASVNVTVYAIGLVADESLTVLPVLDENPIFIRGDANSDRSIDIADPVATLNFLFTVFDDALTCMDGADSNDDGHVLISDPVYTLSFIFLGGPSPRAPFPAPGADATPDAISCAQPTGL